MTHTYRPGQITDADMREEHARLQRALNDPQPEFTYQVLHAAPKKTWGGMVIVADGVDFNPGSGEGMYRRKADNSAWVFVG